MEKKRRRKAEEGELNKSEMNTQRGTGTKTKKMCLYEFLHVLWKIEVAVEHYLPSEAHKL